jgi:hypothetical protein
VSTRGRILAATIVAALHLAILVPLTDGASVIVGPVFQPDAEDVIEGVLPYRDRDFEYPPFALGPVLAPAAVADDVPGYTEAFAWEMIGFDLAIIALLAFGLRAPPGRVAAALGVYTFGIFALSGVLLPDSKLDASLPLARFDLVPAALVLAAVLAREAARSATWSALLGVATAVKAYPLLLYPALGRGESRPLRAIVAGTVPLVLAAALVVAWGDEFGSAIDYHSGRDLQIETLGSSALLVAHLFGADAGFTTGGGSYNVDAPGDEIARALTIALLLVGYALVVWAAWRWRPAPLIGATAVLAVAVCFSPVLSPQFLLWLLPVSAAAFGLGAPNLILLAAVVLTQIFLSRYHLVEQLDAGFVLPLAARNALLLAYVAAVALSLRSGSPAAPAWARR